MTQDTNEYDNTWDESTASTVPFYRKRWKFILLIFGWIIGLGWLTIAAIFWWVGKDVPDLSTLANYRPWTISRVLDRHGDVAMELAEQRRTVVPFKKIPRHLIQAIVSAEDADFFKHQGLSYTGIMRAFWKNLWRSQGSPKQGGSTITQQVVKTFLLTRQQTYKRKLREAILARRLEQNLTKQEILYLYLNQIDFGEGCFGIGEAARYYFGKKVSQLTLAQSVILAGIPKHPPRYNPQASIPHTTRRRNYVLRMMLHNRHITPQQYKREIKRPVAKPRPAPVPAFQKDSFTRYVVRQTLRKLHWVLSQKHPDNPHRVRYLARHLLFRGGLTIETTLDAQAQRLARQVLQQGLASLEKKIRWEGPPFQAAMVILQPQTRRVLGMIEGRYFSVTGLPRAMLLQKPLGTLFQPFVYGAAIASRKFTPASMVHSAPYYLLEKNKQYRIASNSSPRPNQEIRLREAFAYQVTPAAGRVLSRLGRKHVMTLTSKLGFDTTYATQRQMVLGQVKLTPMTLTNAFATLAARGAYDQPSFITRILDKTGKILYERLPNPQRRVSSGVSYLLLHLLQSSMKQSRRGRARIQGSQIAGYAGLTHDRRHAWYVACLPYLCFGFWVGMDNQKKIPRRAKNPAFTFGQRWLTSYLKTPSGRRHRNQSFSQSEDVVFTTIDPLTGLLSLPTKPNAIREAFLYRTQPTQYAP